MTHDRYALVPMSDLWTPDAQYSTWLKVELAALAALEKHGVVPSGTAAAVSARARVDPERIRFWEGEVGHDLVAFLWAVEETAGREGRWLHYGLTSSDVKDTALALTLVRALDLVRTRATRLEATLRKLAVQHRDTPVLGRTHGQAAAPTTFGLKVLAWADELGRVLDRLDRARDRIAVGKLSGAVGTHAFFPPQAEETALASLGLRPCPVTTQVVSRDRHAEVVFALASAASLVEKVALEVRLLSRSEVGEVAEGTPEGSSAMPHKQNPILSERLCGLARVVRAAVNPALEDNALWHERDMSHSSVERVLLPQCFTLVDYMLARAADLVDRLVVFPDRMKEHLVEAGGLPFSEGLLLALVRSGLGRREAHALVARLASQARERRADLARVAGEDPAIRDRLSREELEAVFDLSNSLRDAGVAFDRAWPHGYTG
ncbi:MAG: Adenylosuccinate lyase [Candidatus Bipolaricaulis sibiricus]|uniref:Adenylosuccinate lyase n=1 Tax=Bipolaricaulis sibiricus TaxID=2501609 RepID=A0A410FV18_BIPS1|nr:MAG: Adenylosuccinate lyase [Candidatus Bipolaricaulis sibiricus]